MSLQQLGNCPKCGKLYLRTRGICPDCYQKQEEDFLAVSSYLRRNGGCTLKELTEETEVSISQIRKFIIAGRIILTDLPNLQYPCESCGEMIRKGKTCVKCVETINELASEAERRTTVSNEERKSSGYKSHISDRF